MTFKQNAIRVLGRMPILRRIFYKKNGRIRNKYAKYLPKPMPSGAPIPAFASKPRVLIVAETRIPQCFHYRVQQKQEILSLLGVESTVVSWTSYSSVFSYISTHTHLLLYRVPNDAAIIEAVNIARLLSLKVYYDIDDLIFDVDHYRKYLCVQENISPREQKGLLRGAESYRQMMLYADVLIGSTSALCGRMAEQMSKPVIQIDNAVGQLPIQNLQSEIDLGPESFAKIIYGSGTRTHDQDFKLIEKAIIAVLEKRPDTTLVLVGPLNVSPEILELGGRLKKLPLMPYPEYLGVLGVCDIALAPLTPNIFNNCKSAIKLFEAAAVGIPTISSPMSSFIDAKDLGVPTVLAQTPDEWSDALITLLDDEILRRKIGQRAKRGLEEAYSHEALARTQYLELLEGYDPAVPEPRQQKVNMMIVNLFWKPFSFGGATLVAEGLAGELKNFDNFQVSICTSEPPDSYGSGVRRTCVDGVDKFSILSHLHGSEAWDSIETSDYFREILKFARPEIIHFHCIQGMGVGLMSVCSELKIPYIVTVHDAWWLCARQFLIRADGTFCAQDVIDTRVCSGCVNSPEFLASRNAKLRGALDAAAAVIAPSRYWYDFYLKNGVPDTKLHHVENGIRPPLSLKDRQVAAPRFGFIAGQQVIKGYQNIRNAFGKLDSDLWELFLVDPATNLGGKPFSPPRFGKGKIHVLPGYTQDRIDDVFEKFDVLLFPSLWPESFGLAVREALARGKWVITTNAGSQCEPIEDGVNGRLIPLDDDGTALRTAISEVISGSVTPRHSMKARSIIDVNENARITAQIYKKILYGAK